MNSNSMRRKGRIQWRVILGLSFLGFLIIASASHASHRLPARGSVTPLDSDARRGLYFFSPSSGSKASAAPFMQ